MATKKKNVPNLSVKIELKVTASQIAEPVDKAKVRSRGPNHVGQVKDVSVIRIGSVPQDQLLKRIRVVKDYLVTGRMGGVPDPEIKRSDVTKKETTKKAPPKKKEE